MKPGQGAYQSVLEGAKPAAEMALTEAYLIKAALMGPSGSGKTQSAITLPLFVAEKEYIIKLSDQTIVVNPGDYKPLLLVDYDGRKETVAGEPNVLAVTLYDEDPDSPRAWDRGEDLRKELWVLARSGDFPYSGIIEDSLSMMARIAMNSAMKLSGADGKIKTGLGGAPAKQHYLPQIHYISKHINSMRNLPCHYVLTCHFDLLPTGEGEELKILPKITRSLRTEVPSWFNETYFCFREEGQEGAVDYFWNTAGTGSHEYFKSTLNNKQKYWKDPIQIDFDNPPVGFAHLIQLRFNEKGDKKNEGARK